MAASGPQAAELAGRAGDGLIATSPDKGVIQAFNASGGVDKPRYGQFTVCWAADEGSALQTAREWWSSAAVPGELGQELPLPRHFEQASQLVRDEDIAGAIICGPDPNKHRQKINEFVDAGYSHVYVHQVGPDQAGFFRFYQREVLPHFT